MSVLGYIIATLFIGAFAYGFFMQKPPQRHSGQLMNEELSKVTHQTNRSTDLPH